DGRGRGRPAHDGRRTGVSRRDRRGRRRRLRVEEEAPRPVLPPGPLEGIEQALPVDPGLAPPRHQRGLPRVPPRRREAPGDPAPHQLRGRRDLREVPDRGMEGRGGRGQALSPRSRTEHPPALEDARNDPPGHPVPLRAPQRDPPRRRLEARRRQRPLTAPAAESRRGAETLFFGLSLLVAVAVGLWGLDRFPIFFLGDEAVESVRAASTIRDGFRDEFGDFLPVLFKNGQTFNLGITTYLHMLPTAVFGHSIEATRGIELLFAVSGLA